MSRDVSEFYNRMRQGRLVYQTSKLWDKGLKDQEVMSIMSLLYKSYLYSQLDDLDYEDLRKITPKDFKEMYLREIERK